MKKARLIAGLTFLTLPSSYLLLTSHFFLLTPSNSPRHHRPHFFLRLRIRHRIFRHLEHRTLSQNARQRRRTADNGLSVVHHHCPSPHSRPRSRSTLLSARALLLHTRALLLARTLLRATTTALLRRLLARRFPSRRFPARTLLRRHMRPPQFQTPQWNLEMPRFGAHKKPGSRQAPIIYSVTNRSFTQFSPLHVRVTRQQHHQRIDSQCRSERNRQQTDEPHHQRQRPAPRLALVKTPTRHKSQQRR
jgi:hypothetical protein